MQRETNWYCECSNSDECDASQSVFVKSEYAIAAWNRRVDTPGVPAMSTPPYDVARVIRKSLERYKARMQEVGLMGWYSDSTIVVNEVAHIDAALTWLDSYAERGEG